MCFSFPPDGVSSSNSISPTVTDFADFGCFTIPCDDISGSWIWTRNGLSGDALPVVGTVQVTQENCQVVFEVTTENTTVVLYALMSHQEVYLLNLFDTVEELSAFESYSGDNPPDSIFANNSYAFLQNFESSFPQCQYEGSFLQQGTDFVSTTFGIISRDVERLYSLGDLVPSSMIGLCPDGYPRQWIPSNSSVVPSTATPSILVGGEFPTSAPAVAIPTKGPPPTVAPVPTSASQYYDYYGVSSYLNVFLVVLCCAAVMNF